MSENSFNALVAELISHAPLNELGAGTPDLVRKPLLDQLSAQSLVAPNRPRDLPAARACCSGLWLRYDFLDESHQISQNLDTPDGSFWHAIMHRREGDYSNSRYWLRRVGDHPVLSALGPEAATLAEPYRADPAIAPLIDGADWDPDRFTHLCEQAIGTGTPLETVCREIQRREWDLLFAFCYRKATAV